MEDVSSCQRRRSPSNLLKSNIWCPSHHAFPRMHLAWRPSVWVRTPTIWSRRCRYEFPRPRPQHFSPQSSWSAPPRQQHPPSLGSSTPSTATKVMLRCRRTPRVRFFKHALSHTMCSIFRRPASSTDSLPVDRRSRQAGRECHVYPAATECPARQSRVLPVLLRLTQPR